MARRMPGLFRFGLMAGPFMIAGSAACAPALTYAQSAPPNVIFIMADDLGYAELGSYGQQKIKTPNLDRMAAEGMRFTQFYSGHPVCAPSRAALLTGQHTGHAPVRNNMRVKYPLEGGRTETGNLALPAATQTVGSMLQASGYVTAAIGKWGVGGPGSTGLPTQHGFDRFYGYLDQTQAHNYYPTYLWNLTGEAVAVDSLDNPDFSAHQKLQGDPGDLASYAQFMGKEYAPDLMTREALDFVRANRARPFFLYLGYTIPHVALQVPDEELEQYTFPETPYRGESGYLPHIRPRAAYAGMISRLDGYVGQLLQTLDELQLAGNTLIIFTSDNGTTYNGGVDPEFFNSVGALRGLKNSVYEGGIRVPMIARWPGRIEAGATSDHVGANWDLLPTLAQLTGAAVPAPIDGLSFLPTLLGRESEQQEHEYLYWENHGPCRGQQGIRMGKWKGVRLGIHADRPGPIELYDLATDIGETRDVASAHPEVVRQISLSMREAHTPSPIPGWNFDIPVAADGSELEAAEVDHACVPG